jgi:hypothetical protein
MKEEAIGTSSFNKCVHPQISGVLAGFLLLAGHAGEGELDSGSVRPGSGRWWGSSQAAEVSYPTMAYCGPLIYAVDRHQATLSNWLLLRRVPKQGTYAGGDCPAPATYGRKATLFDMGVPWRRLSNLRLWRPFSGSSAAAHVVHAPSGMFPGGEDDGRLWKLCIGGDLGLDCVSSFIFRVLCAYVQDWFQLLYSLLVLVVKQSVTALN